MKNPLDCCGKAMVMADDPEFCLKCGHRITAEVVHASTMRIANAISEVVLKENRRTGRRGAKDVGPK